MKKIKTSAIIPAYNAEAYIQSVLDALLPQVDELIVVNDCSTDRTPDILKEYDCDKLHVINNRTTNVGPGPCINKAIEKAGGEWIFDIDADEIVPQNAIDKAVKILQGASADTVAVVFGRDTPCLTRAQMLMQLLRGRGNRHAEMPWVTDGPILFKRKIFDEGLRYGTVFPIERMPLRWEMERRGYKMLPANINVLHVGEPSSFFKLLKRQWHYGGQAHRNEVTLRRKHWGQAVLFLSPFGWLGGIALLPELKHEPALRKNTGFVLTMPFLLWIFMFTYYLSFLKGALRNYVG